MPLFSFSVSFMANVVKDTMFREAGKRIAVSIFRAEDLSFVLCSNLCRIKNHGRFGIGSTTRNSNLLWTENSRQAAAFECWAFCLLPGTMIADQSRWIGVTIRGVTYKSSLATLSTAVFLRTQFFRLRKPVYTIRSCSITNNHLIKPP